MNLNVAEIRSGVDRILRAERPLGLVARALRKLASPVVEFGSVCFFVRDLGCDGPLAGADSAVSTRLVPPAQVPGLLLRPDSHDGAVRDAVAQSLRRGDLYFVAFDRQGRPVHARWVARERAFIPELGLEFVPAPGEAYFYDGFTQPHARGGGIDGIVRRHIFGWLQGHGRVRAYSYVRGDNPIGLKAADKWQRRVGTVRYVKLRGLPPFVLGRGSLAARLQRPRRRSEAQRAEQDRAWREWFEAWPTQPLAQRSTGYSALPEEYFGSAAQFVISALRLDPGRDHVLDLGCDSAMLTRLIAPRCHSLVGVDFIPGQVADAVGQRVTCASGRPAEFLAADGRVLPFHTATFTKAYCTGVIHTLPSHDDAMRVVDELIRVCRRGGQVLLGALPVREKRRAAWRMAWQQASSTGRVKLLAGLAVPAALKPALRRVLPLGRRDAIVALVFDLAALKARLEAAGLACRIEEFPQDYWSNDFRLTRSNLVISIPERAATIE